MPGHEITAWSWRAGRLASCEEVIGVDEVGRGAWAGPVTVGALCLPSAAALNYPWIADLRDSKRLSASRRGYFSNKLALSPFKWNLCSVSNTDIDEMGINKATCAAAMWALECFDHHFDVPVVLDGTPESWVHLDDYLKAHFKNWYFLEKADGLVPAVSGAAILAKVERDVDMIEASEFDGDRFDFSHNKGYGTPKHAAALFKSNSFSGMHRMSFNPMKSYAAP